MAAVTGQSPLPEAPPGLSVLEAVLERITYANEDTGYTIARVARRGQSSDGPTRFHAYQAPYGDLRQASRYASHNVPICFHQSDGPA